MTSGLQSAATMPSLASWPKWAYGDYLTYFLSFDGVASRLRGRLTAVTELSATDLVTFCAPIRERIVSRYQSTSPRVSVVMPAYNEEIELLPTLVSYSMSDAPLDLAELIVVDNLSRDRTADVIRACGARYVPCDRQGLRYARDAGVRAAAESSAYIWLTDSDSRVVRPFTPGTTNIASTVLRSNFEYLESHTNVLGISSGGVPEGGHWLYRAIRATSMRMGYAKPYSCWAGYNQFVRRWALQEIGGIDLAIEYGEDHHRHYELARLGKRLKMDLFSANTHPELADPVYYSGRRYASGRLVLRHLLDVLRAKRPRRDEHGYAVYDQNCKWRQVRIPSSK